MTADRKPPESFSLKRWSRVKRETTRAAAQPPAADAALSAAPPAPAAAGPANATQVAPGAPAAELPPIDSLTIDSDFTAFLQPKIDEVLKRRALRKLFADPRFNVMDGLDVYIDDYSKPDPLAPDVARRLAQARAILDARPTRINEQGILEDVPPAERESPSRPVAPAARDVQPAIDAPEALNVAEAPAPGAVSSSPAAEKVAPERAAAESDPKAQADPQ